MKKLLLTAGIFLMAVLPSWGQAPDSMEPKTYDANHGSALIYNGREWNEWVDLFRAFLKAVKIL